MIWTSPHFQATLHTGWFLSYILFVLFFYIPFHLLPSQVNPTACSFYLFQASLLLLSSCHRHRITRYIWSNIYTDANIWKKHTCFSRHISKEASNIFNKTAFLNQHQIKLFNSTSFLKQHQRQHSWSIPDSWSSIKGFNTKATFSSDGKICLVIGLLSRRVVPSAASHTEPYYRVSAATIRREYFDIRFCVWFMY